jgi:hypothetical protein
MFSNCRQYNTDLNSIYRLHCSHVSGWERRLTALVAPHASLSALSQSACMPLAPRPLLDRARRVCPLDGELRCRAAGRFAGRAARARPSRRAMRGRRHILASVAHVARRAEVPKLLPSWLEMRRICSREWIRKAECFQKSSSLICATFALHNPCMLEQLSITLYAGHLQPQCDSAVGLTQV